MIEIIFADVGLGTTWTSLLVLGIVVFLAAVIGNGLTALGVTVPVIAGVNRQVITGSAGLLLAVVALFELNHLNSPRADFENRLDQLSDKADGSPPPPMAPSDVSTHLQGFAYEAGHDPGLNCLIAGFVRDHNMPMPIIIQNSLHQVKGGTSVNWLQCYAYDFQKASQSAATHSAAIVHAVGRLQRNNAVAEAESAPKTVATNILQSATQVGDTGLMYLGVASGAKFTADRTIEEAAIPKDRVVHVKTAVHLHDSNGLPNPAKAPIVGVVPAGASVTVLQPIPEEDQFRWALIRVRTLPALFSPSPTRTTSMAADVTTAPTLPEQIAKSSRVSAQGPNTTQLEIRPLSQHRAGYVPALAAKIPALIKGHSAIRIFGCNLAYFDGETTYFGDLSKVQTYNAVDSNEFSILFDSGGLIARAGGTGHNLDIPTVPGGAPVLDNLFRQILNGCI